MFAQDIASHPSFTERRDCWGREGALTLCGRQDGVLLNISIPCLLRHTINRERGGNLEVAWLADESKSETLLLKPCRRAPLFTSTRQHIDSGWNAIGLLWSRGLFHLAAIPWWWAMSQSKDQVGDEKEKDQIFVASCSGGRVVGTGFLFWFGPANVCQ